MIFYVGMNLIRGIMVAVLFPVMKRIGYGIAVKDSIILVWGGLRGAIGLALALIVVSEESIPHEVRDQILSLTAGIVMLTSLINATTIKPIINWLAKLVSKCLPKIWCSFVRALRRK
jgi:NhaP-type Na+/H+ or K+/H+ antiporter